LVIIFDKQGYPYSTFAHFRTEGGKRFLKLSANHGISLIIHPISDIVHPKLSVQGRMHFLACYNRFELSVSGKIILLTLF
jgi:hypothetical protein